MRIIVALSGGKSSAYCAKWAFDNYPKNDVLLYFNDTKWEHADLYRFIEDISKHFNHEIFYDVDGRTPEELFYYNRALANNRMPFCSRVLKAERLQNFIKDGDIVVFGIDQDEIHRAQRIVSVYQSLCAKKKINIEIKFPLITEKVNSAAVMKWLEESNIEIPELYKLGFDHNNCSGGCVRQGKRQWKRLYEKLPEIYLERERVEDEVAKFLSKEVHFLKDITLKEFRLLIENKQLPSMYYKDDQPMFDCVGICDTLN